MPVQATDEQFLRRALDLARAGIGLASPNPHVGAVLVDSCGTIAGEATYTYDGVKHAEVLALEQARDKARGGTLYINLEPHSHQGRTPPCADALIAAGVRRVVASMPDPNPKVSGKGFEKLRAAGVLVDVGGLESEARRLNEAFARYVRHRVPLVTLKSAMTLDGKIAPAQAPSAGSIARTSARRWITGEAARANVQQQRHQSDAILVGVGTILADDPLLTDRSGKARPRPLLRVILDSRLRLPLESRLVKSVANVDPLKSDVVVFCSSADAKKKQELEERGIRVEQLPPDTNDRPDIHAALHRLGQLEITSLMIEGGSVVNGAVLAAGVVDKVFLYYAPVVMGAGSLPFASRASFGQQHQVPDVKHLHVHRFGRDFAIEGYLRDPYEE